MKRTYNFSQKSKNFLMDLKQTKGTDYARLVIDETINIITNNTYNGICFTINQLKDIKQICDFEKIEINYKIIYTKHENDIDFIRVFRKDIQLKKESYYYHLNKIKKKNKIIADNPSDLSMDKLK